jgi:hypothetical protein
MIGSAADNSQSAYINPKFIPRGCPICCTISHINPLQLLPQPWVLTLYPVPIPLQVGLHRPYWCRISRIQYLPQFENLSLMFSGLRLALLHDIVLLPHEKGFSGESDIGVTVQPPAARTDVYIPRSM